MKKILFIIPVLLCACFLGAQEPSPYLGYKWKSIRITSFAIKGEAPEMISNLEAFKALVEAEKAEGKGRYMDDIVSGFWFYAGCQTWSLPSDTGGKMPDREHQTPTKSSLETAAVLKDAWALFGGAINERAPQITVALEEAYKRILGEK